jgi:hypothetical protein
VSSVADLDHQTPAARQVDRFMSLDGLASSESAIALVIEVSQRLHEHRGTGKRALPSKPFKSAVACILCDLIRTAAGSAAEWGYRSMDANSLTGTPVSHRTVAPAFAAMTALGLVDHRPGYRMRGSESFGARASRYRAAPKLLELAWTFGISPERWHEHFAIPEIKPVVIESPLLLRTAKRRIGGRVADAQDMAIDPADARANALRDRMTRINQFMVGHTFAPLKHRAFRRTFAMGDQPGFSWNKGGRISSIGQDTYQGAKKARRAEMTIDGHVTVEIDVVASHLTILHGLRGVPFDRSRDPYEIDGIPRDVVKAWVTMTLGHNGFHRAWTAGTRRKLAPAIDGELQAIHPIREVRQRVSELYPILNDWPSCHIRWADLQFAESAIVMRAMEDLAFNHNAVCLPVHDSIIIPLSQRALAVDVMERSFVAELGILPRLKWNEVA